MGRKWGGEGGGWEQQSHWAWLDLPAHLGKSLRAQPYTGISKSVCVLAERCVFLLTLLCLADLRGGGTRSSWNECRIVMDCVCFLWTTSLFLRSLLLRTLPTLFNPLARFLFEPPALLSPTRESQQPAAPLTPKWSLSVWMWPENQLFQKNKILLCSQTA